MKAIRFNQYGEPAQVLAVQEHLHLLYRSSGWSVCFPAWVRSGSSVDQRLGLLPMTLLEALS
jgi:hypothetical protein